MQKNEHIAGIWTAIATPFYPNGDIDFDAFERLLHCQVSAGIEGIVIAGTTGESPTLDAGEKNELIARARDFLPNSVRIMAGTGTSATKTSINNSIAAEREGADSLLVVTPPYNKPNTEGLIRHYREIRDSVDLPICLYHVPARTHQKLTIDQFSYLLEQPEISAVKEASGDLKLFANLCALTAKPILSGDDPTFLASLAVGGSGLVSVITNIFPKPVVAMFRLLQQNQGLQEPQAINKSLIRCFDFLASDVNPVPLKCALEHLGFGSKFLRLPLFQANQATEILCLEVLSHTRALLEERNIPS